MSNDRQKIYFFPAISKAELLEHVPEIQSFNSDSLTFKVKFPDGFSDTFLYEEDKLGNNVTSMCAHSVDNIIAAINWWEDYNTEDEIRNAWVNRIGKHNLYFYLLVDTIKKMFPHMMAA